MRKAPPPYSLTDEHPLLGFNQQAPNGIIPIIFGPHSQLVICPYCHLQISTEVEYEASLKTHLLAFLLLLICIPCAPIPYCLDSCQTQNHYCPNCGRFLGTYNN